MRYAFCPVCSGQLTIRRFKDTEPERMACTRCEFIHYDAPSIAVGGILAIDGGIVLLRRAIDPGYGEWVFPGGYVDRGETVEEAVVRETREEVGVTVRVDSLLNVYSYRRSGLVIIVYETSRVQGEVSALDEALDARVFAPTEIPWNALAFPSTRQALAEYLMKRGISNGR
jgi:mutator protein MutT